MKSFIILFSLLFLSATIFAQTENMGTGAILDYEKLSSVPKQEELQGAKVKRSPPKYSLRKYCPRPGFQAQTNSCVAWAIGYGAMTIIKAIQNENTDINKITDNAFSPYFIFNQISNEDCSNASIVHALKLLKEQGNCLNKSFPNSR